MAGGNSKSTDRLIQLICRRWWSEGESHKYNLDQYDVNDAELPFILQKVKDRGLGYKLNKSSNGKNTIKVYKPSDSNTWENVRAMMATFLLFVAMLPASTIFVLMLVCVYPFFTFVTKLISDDWISVEDFSDAYWDFVFSWDG